LPWLDVPLNRKVCEGRLGRADRAEPGPASRPAGIGQRGPVVADPDGHIPGEGDHAEAEAEAGLVYRKPDAEECREECSS